jgi:hypothetical protein
MGNVQMEKLLLLIKSLKGGPQRVLFGKRGPINPPELSWLQEMQDLACERGDVDQNRQNEIVITDASLR